MSKKLLTIKFRIGRELAQTLHDMMWCDSSESESPKVRRAAKVVVRALRKELTKP